MKHIFLLLAALTPVMAYALAQESQEERLEMLRLICQNADKGAKEGLEPLCIKAILEKLKLSIINDFRVMDRCFNTYTFSEIKCFIDHERSLLARAQKMFPQNSKNFDICKKDEVLLMVRALEREKYILERGTNGSKGYQENVLRMRPPLEEIKKSLYIFDGEKDFELKRGLQGIINSLDEFIAKPCTWVQF